MSSPAVRALPAAGFLVYAVLAHAAVVLQSESLTVAGVALLGIVVLAPALARRPVAALVALALLAGAIAVLVQAELVGLVLYAPPVLFSWFAAWVFGSTLLPGEVPLIERFARLLHGPGEPLDSRVLGYTRRVTVAWCVLLALLGLVSLALALCAEPGGLLLAAGLEPPLRVPREIWSLCANLLNYAAVALFFVLEYVYRRLRFPQQPYRNFLEFLQRAAAASPRVFGRQSV